MTSQQAESSPPVKRKKSESVPSPSVKPLLEEPRLIATIDSWYERGLYGVSCVSDEQIWTHGDDETMKLFDLQGNLLTSIQTESGNETDGTAVTQGGDLVYTDFQEKHINLVKNKQMRTVITLQGWFPFNVCSTSSGDLLVVMSDDYLIQTRVVRYSGSTETQTIQFDGQGQPLYSPASGPKFISENRNQDICVADSNARAVVVVNQSGKLRFRYTGHPSNAEESFDPIGITTDSQSHILTSDMDYHRIHILDQDGQFLRYIQNYDLRLPFGLCVDSWDNLFVAERDTTKVKRIQYILS